MPIREYHCTECGHDFEVIESPSTATQQCESCGGRKIERLLSVFAARGSSTPDSPCQDFGCSTDQRMSGQCASGACPMIPN